MNRLLFGLALLAACKKPAATAPADDAVGVISVQWAGAVRGKFNVRGSSRWCATDSLLEVSAIRGDSGFGMALIEPDSIRPGQHPVVAPSVPVPWRPMAIAALRWVTDTAVKGFEANSGNISVTEVQGGSVSGTIDVRLKQTDTDDTIRLTGRFTKIPIEGAVSPCGRFGRGTP